MQFLTPTCLGLRPCMFPLSREAGRGATGSRPGWLNEIQGPTLFSLSDHHTRATKEQSPDLYSPKPSTKPTMQVSIRSNGHPNLKWHIIRQIISIHQILLLNYGRADTWYFSADTFDVTELHNTTKHYGPYKLLITTHQKDRIHGTIRWVHPALKNETIVQALRIDSKLEPTISEVPHTNNRSFQSSRIRHQHLHTTSNLTIRTLQ